MIPDVAKTGTSFKGALAYYLHDKKRDGEEQRLSSERVEWTETRNMMTNDPEMAGKVMAATAMDANHLKAEAGIKNTGRKSNNHVYAYTLAWHPDEAGKITRADMKRAVDETLRVLGAEDHQALLVAHNDTNHPHVHVIVNRVSPVDGRMLKTSNDHLKLSQWALNYREMRNEKHYCPRRAENWGIRLSRNDEKDRLKYWRASGNVPRSMIEDVKKGIAANDDRTDKVADQFKQKAGKLAAEGKATKERHAQEWKSLSARYRERKAKIYGQTEKLIGDTIASVKATYRPDWQQLGRRHARERREFKEEQASLVGAVWSTLKIVLKMRHIDPDSSRGVMGDAFNLLTNAGYRAVALERLQNTEVRKLGAQQKAEIGAAISKLKTNRAALLKSARKRFLSERESLIESQNDEKQALRAKWKQHNEERKRAFKTSRKSAKSRREASKEGEAEPSVAKASHDRGQQYKAASTGRNPRKPRATGRTRSRKRSRSKGD